MTARARADRPRIAPWHGAALTLCALVLFCGYAALAQPRAYISNEKSNDVTVIHTQTDKVVATVPVGERPRGIRLSPEGKSLYLALGDEDHIGVVDTTTLQVAAKISAGTDPEMFDVSPDGKRLYVSNDVSVIDTEARRVITTIPVGRMPWGVAVAK